MLKDSLKMTIEEWINYKIPLNEVIINCSIKNGSDFFYNHPILLHHPLIHI